MEIFQQKALMRGKFPPPRAIHHNHQIPIYEVFYKYIKNFL